MILEKTRIWVENHMYVDLKMIDLLIARGIVTPEQAERILAYKIRRDRNAQLIREIYECNRKTFNKFKLILKQTRQNHILDPIEYTDWLERVLLEASKS